MTTLNILDFSIDTSGLVLNSQCSPVTQGTYNTFSLTACTTINCNTIACTTIDCTTINCTQVKCSNDGRENEAGGRDA